MSSSPPRLRPLLAYDADCGFCRRWIARWQETTGERVEYLPYGDPRVQAAFPHLTLDDLQHSIQFADRDGTFASGAEAVFRALATVPGKGGMLAVYRTVPGVRFVSELVYRFVACHRKSLSWITRLLWGEHVQHSTYILSQTLFLRFLGLIYLFAFGSLFIQVLGLAGSQGILPASHTLHSLRAAPFMDRIWTMPTVFWWSATNQMLRGVCGTGIGLSVLLIIGLYPLWILALLWIFYLSLFTVLQPFLGYQWDILLLEVGFLAIFLAPRARRLKTIHFPRQPTIILWLFHWLLFRLMFQSGCVKLLSGDRTWRNLTALTFHYETQPLPTWIGWYAHQLPEVIQKASAAGMFGVELILPFFIFLPRRAKCVAAFGFVLFQILIGVTGNYAFFNWLGVALCLLLLDDAAWLRSWRVRAFYLQPEEQSYPPRRWPKWVLTPIAVILLTLSSVQLLNMFRVVRRWPRPVVQLFQTTEPFHLVSGYGLFAVMTTSRPEIIVEGSEDGQEWKSYEFKFKPGDPTRKPSFVAPHQPRLDWQMWFAALGSCETNPWFLHFARRLMEGSKDVASLLAVNPFPDDPPNYIRTTVYDYRFTRRNSNDHGDSWWRREELREYCPILTLGKRGTRA